MKDVVTSRRFILEALQEADMVSLDGNMRDSCLMHPDASHDMETCSTVEELLQRMMDQGWFEIYVVSKEDQHVCMQSADKSPSKPKPLVIHFTRDATSQKTRGSQLIPGSKSVPFPYGSNNVVPWRYAPQKPNKKKDEAIGGEISFAKVTNIIGISGVTCNGHVFVAPDPLVQSKEAKGKAKVGAEEIDKTAFQSFEVVSNASIESLPVQPSSFSVMLMVARVMLGHVHEPEMGLGRNGDGVVSLVEFMENRRRFRLEAHTRRCEKKHPR
ncbi:hypothetical protein HKD37_20G055778 [Glycine soja]